MSSSILITLLILGTGMVFFITEWLSADLVALLTLSALAVAGLVSPEEALAGFSNPAVVTTWAVFILSVGLSRTGVAAWIGRQVLKLGGGGEIRTLLVLMLVSALLSGFMNNVGVAALMLPVVLDICRRTGLHPARMLLPLALSAHLGGMTTLIGTPTNILVSGILLDYGLDPYAMFDFTPFGLVIVLAGVFYLVAVGRRLSPWQEDIGGFETSDHDMSEEFAIEERLFVVALPQDSQLDGYSLGRSRIGAVLGLNVIGLMRAGHTALSPDADTILHGGDRLLVTGRVDILNSWNRTPQFKIISHHIPPEYLTSDAVELVEATLPSGSELVGKTIEQLHFRQQYGSIVLSVWRNGAPLHYRMESVVLQQEDRLLLQVTKGQVEVLKNTSGLDIHPAEVEKYLLDEAITLIKITPGSNLCNQTIAESHLGDAYHLGVLGIIRNNVVKLLPVANETILSDDQLLIKVRPEAIKILEALHRLEIDYDAHPSYTDMESDMIGLQEVVISPQSSLPGKTLRDAHFREKYGLSVLAIWRSGTTRRSGLRDMKLRFGDALLIFGPRDRLHLLSTEPDFIPLTEEGQVPPRIKRAPLAALIMVAVVLTAGIGWIPIALSAVIGGTLMVLTGCITMGEAYRSIEWKAIFLIAGMLPLGTAMQTSGTAQFLANAMVDKIEPYGIYALIAGLYLLTMLATQVMPNPVVTVLMAPIALSTALDLGYSPYTFLMVVAVGASSSFLTPVGHAANILVMGPGRYKFSDYFKVGLPLALVILLLVVFVLPIIWPL